MFKDEGAVVELLGYRFRIEPSYYYPRIYDASTIAKMKTGTRHTHPEFKQNRKFLMKK